MLNGCLLFVTNSIHYKNIYFSCHLNSMSISIDCIVQSPRSEQFNQQKDFKSLISYPISVGKLTSC